MTPYGQLRENLPPCKGCTLIYKQVDDLDSMVTNA